MPRVEKLDYLEEQELKTVLIMELINNVAKAHEAFLFLLVLVKELEKVMIFITK